MISLNDESKSKALISNVYHVFNTEAGKILLKHFDEYLKAPVANPAKSPYYAYFREGENNIIRQMLNCIYEYDNPTETTQTNDEEFYD